MSWTETTIDAVTELVTKGTTPTTYGMPFTEEGVNFVKAEALNGDGALDRAGFTFISPETHEKLKRSQLKAGDVLMTIAGANVGKCGLVREADLPANTNQAVALMRVNCEVADPRFVYYHFKQPWMLSYCRSLGGQAAQPNVNLANLKRFKIPLPDLPTQQRIAGILSAYDDLIENNRRRIALLEQAARLLYREWFVHLRFPGHETVKIVDGLPEGWRQGTVGELGQVVTGKTPSKKVAENFGGDIPFIKTPDMHGNIFVLSSEETLSEQGAKSQLNKTIPAGSVLVSCIGSVGVVAMTSQDCQFNQQINAVVPANGISQFYCYFVLSALKPRLEAIGGGATMANVNKSKFESLSICLPSADAQRSFQEAAQPLFDMLLGLSRQNAKLIRARDLLLPRLMDGRIPV